jgi:hypothetical protein
MWWATGALAVPGLVAAPAAAAVGTNVRFEIDQPFRIGEHGYDAGVIAVQNVSAYTPSTAMLEVWVNDECLGMMPAYLSGQVDGSGPAEALFRRDEEGRLQLTGFQLSGQPNGAVYRFR